MGRKEQRERERKKAAKGRYALSEFGFLPKSDRGPTVTWTRRRRVSGSSWKRTALRDHPASYKNKTKEALCSRLQRLKWVLIYSNFFPAGPQNASPVLNDLARLRATAKFQITPACDFRESILIPFFFLVCLHVDGDFVCSFLFLFGISSRRTHRFDRPWSFFLFHYPLIVTRQNQQAAPVCSKVCWTCSGGLFCRCSIVKKSVCLYLV